MHTRAESVHLRTHSHLVWNLLAETSRGRARPDVQLDTDTRTASLCRAGSENRPRANQFQLVQGRQYSLPTSRVLLGFKRQRKVCIEIQDVVAQASRGHIELPPR